MMIHIINVRDPRKFVVKLLNGIKVSSLMAKIEEILLKSALSFEGTIAIFGPDKPVK